MVQCRSHSRCVFVDFVAYVLILVLHRYRRYNLAFLRDRRVLSRVEALVVVAADHFHPRRLVIWYQQFALFLCLVGGRRDFEEKCLACHRQVSRST